MELLSTPINNKMDVFNFLDKYGKSYGVPMFRINTVFLYSRFRKLMNMIPPLLMSSLLVNCIEN